MNEHIYLDTAGLGEVRLRPRPADRPFIFQFQDNALSGLKLDQQDLEYLDTQTNTVTPIACDAEGRYFFKRDWKVWLEFEAGKLNAVTRLLKKDPSLWSSQDFPRHPGVPLWQHLLTSSHTDSALIRLWEQIPDDLRNEQLNRALIHERPLLAESLWQAGARFGTDAQSLHSVILTWLNPDTRKMAGHLGVTPKEHMRVQYETVPTPKYGPKVFAGEDVRSVAVMVAEQWGERLEGAAATLPLHPQFPVLVTFTKGTEVTQATVTHSWASYLMNFGCADPGNEMDWGTILAITQSQLSRFRGMGLDLSKVSPPPDHEGEKPVTWLELARRRYSDNADIQAQLRKDQTASLDPTPTPKRNRPRP